MPPWTCGCKRQTGKSAVCEGQLLQGRADSAPHGHWASGTKQRIGLTAEMLPLSSQRAFSYIVTEIKELGKTTCPSVEERRAGGPEVAWVQRLLSLETELGWLGDRCGGRKHTTMQSWHQALRDHGLTLGEMAAIREASEPLGTREVPTLDLG